MNCYVCKYNFCWTCGFASDSFFHKIQLDTSETGFLCVIINKITHNEGIREEMWIKNMFIRYVLSLIAVLVLPGLMLALALIVGALCLPFLPIYYYFVFTSECCECFDQINKCISIFVQILILILVYPLILAIFVVLAAISIVLAALAFVLFYLVFIVLMFRMLFMHCCRSKKTSNSKLKEIEKYIK